MEKKIKLVVRKSGCDLYKVGDEIYLNGPVIDTEKSVNVCLTAINSFYPFIYAARKGVTAEAMGFDKLIFQCPDCPEEVHFELLECED